MFPILPLVKADAEQRLVWARAAVEEPDKAREIMDYATARPQFELWSKGFSDATLGKSLGNIRAMHNPRHLAGKVQEIVFDDAHKSVQVCIKVLDPVDWTKVEEGGYTGLSIGGGYLKKWQDGELTRYTPRIAEISLVDSPCMPGARILELQKQDGSIAEVLLKGIPRSFAALQPPRSFADLRNSVNPDLHKSLLSNITRLTARVADHQAVKLAAKGYKAAKTAREVATFGAGAVGAAGGASAYLENRKRKPEDAIRPVAQKQAIIDNLAKIGFHPLRAIKEGVVADATGGGNLKYGFWHGLLANSPPKTPVTEPAAVAKPRKLAMPAHMRKQAIIGNLAKGGLLGIGGGIAGGAALGVGLGLLHGRKPAKKHGLLGHLGYTALTGGSYLGYRAGRALAAKSPPKLAMPAHMQKQAIIGNLAKARGAKRTTLANLSDEHNTEGRIDTTGKTFPTRKEYYTVPRANQAHSSKGKLSDKQHDQRIAAAKARWLKEGHDDHDTHHDKLEAHAGKAFLGRANKVTAVQQQRKNFWHGVADSQDAYDKVRKHLPAAHNLMMEVPHAGGLLYNPEGVGDQHFGHNGDAKQPLHLLHPAEVDDWIKHHGSGAVAKLSPRGLISHISELVMRVDALTEAA